MANRPGYKIFGRYKEQGLEMRKTSSVPDEHVRSTAAELTPMTHSGRS